MAVFVPNEPGFQFLLENPAGPVGVDLQRRLINAVNLAKINATGAPVAGANNPEGRGPRVRTGRLRSSITHEVSSPPLVGRYGSNVPYGFFLETGLRGGRTYPFLLPATVALAI